MLSPLLFNVYLEEALKSEKELESLIQKQMLRAFADDVVCVAKTPDELRGIIKSFEKLMDKSNLQINKKKIQF